MTTEAEGTTRKIPAIPVYQFACVAGLVVMLLAMASDGSAFLGLVVAAAGLLGVLSRVRLAPVLLLLVLTAALFAQQLIRGGMGWQGQWRSWAFRGSDVALCCGALAYVAAHFRLQALADHILPVDSREREAVRPGRRLWFWRPGPVRRPRSADLVAPWELSLFFLTLPAWALLAQACWSLLARRGEFLELPAPFVRFLVLAWALVLGSVVATSFLGQWRRRTMTPTEAALILQDVVWRETRGEQRRLQRWLTWAKLRRSK